MYLKLGHDHFFPHLFINHPTFNDIYGRAMAQAVSRWSLTVAARVHAQVNPVGYVVNKAALGQVFLRVLQSSPVNTILQWAPHFGKLKRN
jgi:hypothetical protein